LRKPDRRVANKKLNFGPDMPRSEGVAFDDIVATYPYSGDHQAWTYYTTMAQVIP